MPLLYADDTIERTIAFGVVQMSDNIDNYALIIGAMKCGTTTLFTYLAKHPEIAPCYQKEPNFFASDENWSKGLAWYESLWDYEPNKHKIALEGSTHYTKYYTKTPRFPNAAERIAQIKANFKFIYMIRNPIERIESQYTHGLSAKWFTSQQPIKKGIHPHLLEVSRYAKQMDEYYKRFPAPNIRLVNFEDLKSNLSNLLTEICQFLEIDPTYNFQINSKIYNPTKGKFIDGSLWHLISPLTKTLPTKLQQSIRRSLGQQVRDNVRLTQEQRDFVLRELREDLLKLQFEYGVDVSRWGIEL